MQGGFNFIHSSFKLFPKLTKNLFGWEYNMTEIENKLSHVKEHDCFGKDDFLRIMEAKEWDYKKFWPDLTTVTLDKPIVGVFRLRVEEKKRTIAELYKRFLHIEIVSVILRFVDPQHYAIISPPVENFFSLQPKEDHVEYYINYLNSLKKTQKHFQFPSRIADVDMAIWGLSFLLKSWSDIEFQSKWEESDKSIIELILFCYKTDRFFKKMRLCEVLRQAYQDIEGDECEPNRLLLADCLDSAEIDPELAMITASFCYESFLWKLIEETGKAEEFKALDSRKKWIEKLRDDKIFETYSIFSRCLSLRNRSVHPWAERLRPAEREEFIDNLEKLIQRKKANNL